MHVFNKKTKTTFKNLADVAAQFVQDVRTANAGAAQCAKPPFAEKNEDVQQTKGSVALRSFSSGSLSATALPPAVAQGSLVVDGEKNQFKVKSVFTDSGKLLLAPCDEARKDDVFSIIVAQFMDEYKVFEKKCIVTQPNRGLVQSRGPPRYHDRQREVADQAGAAPPLPG